MKLIVTGRKIVKSFRTGAETRTVLNQVSLEIAKGEFVSVMGPSGSGKSTLLYALGGLDEIDGGQVLFEEQNLTELSDRQRSDLRRTRMGFVFQQPALLKNLNLLDNIILPLMRDHPKEADQLAGRANMLMAQLGIGDLASRDITQVSGGQLQRAGICRALMCQPDIIFGDEPTGALNSQSAREVMDLLAQINRNGTAILLVTHDAQVAARTSRVMFMSDGTIAGRLDFPAYRKEDHEKRVEQILVRMRNTGI